MRKLFLFAAGLAMTLAACQKEEAPTSAGATSQTITVSIPQGVQTRAAAAEFGDGSKVDRCLLQIYRNGQPYGEQQTATVTNNTATFNLRLVAQQTYDFVFWADCETAGYQTDNLSAITLGSNVAYTGNDDKFDAFFLCEKEYTVTESFSETFTLRRPFGQLNVKTLDLAAIPDNAADLKPAKVKVNFTSLPNTFNALTGGESGTAENVEYTADILDATSGELTVDYIWAPVEQATLADFTMTFLDAGGNEISTNSDFKSIPIRRNYRTMVSGNLLTKQGDITVTIDPDFYEPDIVDYPELRAAFANGGSVTLSEDVKIEKPLVVASGKTVDVDLNGHDIINTTSLPYSGSSALGETVVFKVEGGTLNIKGDGDVQAISSVQNQDGYRMAVWAVGSSTVNIYGGNFVNDQDFQDHSAQLDLIYADQNAVINIYGGTFESKSANSRGYWVLNLKDNSSAAINVYGGTFINFDPSSSMTENPVKNFVVETSNCVKTSDTPSPNDTYVVVPKNAEVASVEEFSNALRAGSKTIRLNEDITLTGNTVVKTGTQEIDMNGKTLTMNNMQIQNAPAAASAMVRSTAAEGLTIKGGTLAFSGSATSGLCLFAANTTLTLDGVTIDGSKLTNSAICIGHKDYPDMKNNTLIVKNSTINATGSDCVGILIENIQTVEVENSTIRHRYFGIDQNGTYPGSTVKVSDTDIEGTYTGIYLSNHASGPANTLEVKGGRIISELESGIEVKKTNITVSGATLGSKATTQSYPGINGNGSNAVGYGIALVGHAAGTAYEGTQSISNVTYELGATGGQGLFVFDGSNFVQ